MPTHTTDLAAGDAALALPSPDLSSPDIRLHLWARVMALKDGTTATPVSIEAHLRQCALVLDHAFTTLMREALADPARSRRTFETALYAQNLFRQIIEQLRRSERKKVTKRNDKKRRLERRW